MLKTKIEQSLKIKIINYLSIIVGLFIRIINIDVPLVNELHAFRQTETAIVIKGFLKEGISLFNYEIPILGEPWHVIFECPIYQGIVYAFMKLYGLSDVDMCCKVISIFIFILTAFALNALIELLLDNRTASFVTIIYIFMPYTIYWSRAALIDYTSVLFGLLYMYYIIKWMKNQKFLYFLLTLLFGILAYLQKSTTMFPVVFILAVYIIYSWFLGFNNDRKISTFRDIFGYHKKKVLENIGLAIMCLIPAVLGLLWSEYADIKNSEGQFTTWATSSELHEWYYGTLLQRFSLNCWRTILSRLGLFGGNWVVIIGLMLFFSIICQERTKVLATRVLGCAIFVPIFVLFNLYYVHDYYLISVTPFVAAFLGIIICETTFFIKLKSSNYMTVILILSLVVLMINENAIYINGVFSPKKANESIGLIIKNCTDDKEHIVIEGEDWSPVTAYYAERKCLMLKSIDWFQDVKNKIEENEYEILLGHNLNIDNELLESIDEVLSYVSPEENTYLYKVLNPTYIKSEQLLSISPLNEIDKEYDVSTRRNRYIYLKYGEIEQSRTIKINMAVEQGNIYIENSGYIGLLSHHDGMFIDINSLSPNISKIWFEGLEDLDYNVFM